MQDILYYISNNVDTVLARETPLDQSMWVSFIELHHIDIARFFSRISRTKAQRLFSALPDTLKTEVFNECSEAIRIFCLSNMDDRERVEMMNTLSLEELTNLFDDFSDEELKKYLNLLNKNLRQQVISLMQFDHKAVGKIMDTHVLTLIEDFTVEQSVKLLQRLTPRREIHQHIYVTDQAHKLKGYINLEDLLLNKPDVRITSFMLQADFVIHPHDDREEIAKKMVYYGLMSVPVVDDNNQFLGVIPSETLVDVIVQEVTEDIHRMASLTPMRESYLEAPIIRLLMQRGVILVVLLLAESISSYILSFHEAVLGALLTSFIPMLISTGGNMSNQTSAVVIKEMSIGSVGGSDTWRLLRRETVVAFFLAILLGLCSFLRVYFSSGAIRESIIVGSTISCIIILSATVGSCFPFLLRRLNIDSAFSAGPMLATIMDVLGVLTFCYISQWLFL